MLNINNNLKFFTILWLCVVFLLSCTSLQRVYVKPFDPKTPPVKRVFVMIEYLRLYDDLKGYWNFDETKNLFKQDEYDAVIRKMLLEKGYEVSPKSLKTSGLIMERTFFADHFINKHTQKSPISPPYIIRSIDLDDTIIQSLESLLLELNQPISSVLSDYQSHIYNNFKSVTDSVNLIQEDALVILSAYEPKVSPFANINLDVFASSGANGASINIADNEPRSQFAAYFIHLKTGELLWSNKTSSLSKNYQQQFFMQFPTAQGK